MLNSPLAAARSLKVHLSFNTSKRSGLAKFTPQTDTVREKLRGLLTGGWRLEVVDGDLQAVIELRLVQHKGDSALGALADAAFAAASTGGLLRGQVESLKVEPETDNMNRAVIHITLKGSGTLPNVVKLRDQELARALFPTVPLREVEKQLGRPLRELSYNTLVFDLSLPAVAALGDDEQLQTFVAPGFVRIWEQAPGPWFASA